MQHTKLITKYVAKTIHWQEATPNYGAFVYNDSIKINLIREVYVHVR